MPSVYIYAITCALLLLGFLWNRRKLYSFAFKLNGPYSLPLIGNGLLFIGKTTDCFEAIMKLINSHSHPMQIWLGPKLLAIFSDVSHAEKLLSSSKLLHKGSIYKFIGEFGGSGLITASGNKWKEHRKLIAPMINNKYVESSITAMEEHVRILLGRLETLSGDEYVDILPVIHSCCFDIVGDIIFGLKLRTQEGENQVSLSCFKRMYDNIFLQIVKPWLHPHIIFKMTALYKERKLILNEMNVLVSKAVSSSEARSSSESNAMSVPLIDTILKSNGTVLSSEEIRDHLITLFGASEDPSTLIVSSACLCFGMDPDYQNIAFQEIRSTIGDSYRPICMNDLSKLNYLDRCIKDVMRLFPIAPFIIRLCTEEFKLENLSIPVGCEIVIPILKLHTDENQWARPYDFFPDHFTREEVQRRHSYAYAPFSLGPRACIGQPLANRMIKFLVATILQHYEFEANGSYKDLKFKTDISLRIVGGYQVKIKKRKWE